MRLKRRQLQLLPIAALRLPAEMVAGLSKLGFDSIGDLDQYPACAASLAVWSRAYPTSWIRSFGRTFESFDPIEPPATCRRPPKLV